MLASMLRVCSCRKESLSDKNPGACHRNCTGKINVNQKKIATYCVCVLLTFETLPKNSEKLKYTIEQKTTLKNNLRICVLVGTKT
jgi:hypothetical protein